MAVDRKIIERLEEEMKTAPFTLTFKDKIQINPLFDLYMRLTGQSAGSSSRTAKASAFFKLDDELEDE